MMKIKEIQSDCIYLFSGKASANSVFVESLAEAREFLNSANERFFGYIKIHEYLTTKDGWSMICEIESVELIIKTYLNARKANGREYKNPPFEEVWRIVSEQVRHWLSRFIKNCNFNQGRTGSKVHSSYERRLFLDVADAKQYIIGMHEQTIEMGQKRKKYRGKKSHFSVGKKKCKGHIFLCSKGLNALCDMMFEEIGAVVSKAIQINVLRKLIDFTISHHFPQLHQFNTPKLE